MKIQNVQLKALLDHLWFCRSMYSHRQTTVTALSIFNWMGHRNYKPKVNSRLEVEEEGCLEFLFSVVKAVVFPPLPLCIYFSKFFSFMHDHSCGWALQFLRIQFVILSFITVKGQFLAALTSHHTMNFALISCFCISLQEQSEDQQLLPKASQSPVFPRQSSEMSGRSAEATASSLAFLTSFQRGKNKNKKTPRKAQKKKNK